MIFSVEIIYKGNSAYSGIANSYLTIILDGKEYRVRWHKGPGNLPDVESVDFDLVTAGLFQGLESKRVPILADEYSLTVDGYRSRTVLKPGHYISGILVKLLEEKRLYVMTTPFKGEKGYYMVPKVGKF